MLKHAKLSPRQDLMHLIHGKSTVISGRSSIVDFSRAGIPSGPPHSFIIAIVRLVSDVPQHPQSITNTSEKVSPKRTE